MDQFKVVLEDGHFFEGPRWRDGRLFASDFFGHQVLSTDLSGDVRVEARVENQPSGLGWTPDGRLLIVSMLDKKLLRREASGELIEVASLGEHSYGQQTNDMLVDSEGRAYISSIGFDPHVGENIQPAPLIRVDPDGSVHEAAPREMFMPNGIALLPGNVLVVAETLGNRLTAFDVQPDGSLANQRAWAEFGPRLDTDDLMAGMGQVVVGSDGIVADSEGAVWAADSLGNRAVRVAEGGQILQEISTGELGCYSCTLGGPDGRTLFLCVAPDFTPENRSKAAEAKIFAVEVDVPR